jgi:ABC-type transport system substrate-binding protein
MGGITDPHFARSTIMPNSQRYIVNPQRQDRQGNNIPKIDRDYEQRIAEIFNLAVQEIDEEKRAQLYFEWQRIDREHSHFIYLPIDEVILGVNNRLGNIHLTSHLAAMESLIHNIEYIYVR